MRTSLLLFFAFASFGSAAAHAYAERFDGRTDDHTRQIAVDGLGRVESIEYLAATSGEVLRERFERDGDGNPTRIEQVESGGGVHVTQRSYDAHGRLVSESDRFSQSISLSYDAVGNRIRRDDPAGTTTYQPDRLHRTAQVTVGSQTTALSYTAEGRISEVVHPNGASSSTSYDALGRTAQIVHRQHGVVVATFSYDYDRNGNRKEEVLSDAAGTRTTTYDYDTDDRLVAVEIQHPNGSIERSDYVLDGVGNRMQEQRRLDGVLQANIAYDYDSRHRITERSDSISGQVTTYEHDANGHLTQETTGSNVSSYRPNVQDRLATLTLPGAPPVSFAYDAEGKRVERRSATEVRRFGWDGTRLRRETNAANNLLEAHDWAAGRLLRSQGIASIRYAQHDALASPIRWSRSDGGEQGRLSYDAWGVTTSTGADLPRIAYTGHYLDSDTGDYYAQQRYYRPGLGRFTRVDPWEGDDLRPITLNKYLYANGNPLIYVDPDGRIAFLSDWQDVTSDAVASYERDIERATQEGAGGRAFLLGIGKGLASIGDFAVTGLNTTSNLLARNLYDGDTYAQAQREIESNQQAMSQAIEAVHRTALVVQEDPTGAAVAVKDAAIAFSVDVAMGEPRAMAALGEFTGQLVVPGAGAKGLKVTGESLDTARSALRMGDGFIDAGMADELAAVSQAAGRGGVDVRHSPQTEVPFGRGVGNQGFAYEDALAARMPVENRLPPNFKTFDFLLITHEPQPVLRAGTAVAAWRSPRGPVSRQAWQGQNGG